MTRAATIDSTQGAFLDRPFLSIDTEGNLSLIFLTGDAKDRQIGYVSSKDRGATWSSLVIASPGHSQTGPSASVARMGNQVVAAWFEGSDGKHAGDIWVATSSDGGKTFQEPNLL